MKEEAKVGGMRFDERTILQAPSETLQALVGRGVQTVFGQLKAEGTHVLDCHATFLPTTGFIEGISFADVELLNPDVLLTIIEGPQQIHEALREHPAEYFDLSIADIVKWQEMEVYISARWARILDKPHFVVPRSHADRILPSLLFDRKAPVYASYPMTELSETEKSDVKKFVDRLWEPYTVFDPGSIESSHGTKPYFSPADRRAIFSHTIVRDLNWFIGVNSDSVIAFMMIRGNGNGAAVVPSSGSNDELRYAHESGVETYLVMGRSSGDPLPRISPFTWYKAKMFVTPDEFFYYINLSSDLRSAYDIIAREVTVWLRTAQDEVAGNGGYESLARECKLRCQYHLTDGHFKTVEGELDDLVKRLAAAWQVVPVAPSASGKGN